MSKSVGTSTMEEKIEQSEMDDKMSKMIADKSFVDIIENLDATASLDEKLTQRQSDTKLVTAKNNITFGCQCHQDDPEVIQNVSKKTQIEKKPEKIKTCRCLEKHTDRLKRENIKEEESYTLVKVISLESSEEIKPLKEENVECKHECRLHCPKKCTESHLKEEAKKQNKSELKKSSKDAEKTPKKRESFIKRLSDPFTRRGNKKDEK